MGIKLTRDHAAIAIDKMRRLKTICLSGVSFHVYLSPATSKLKRRYPRHCLDGFYICFISVSDFLKTLCGISFLVIDQFEINPSLWLYRKIGEQFYDVTQDDIHRHRMSMSEIYIAYDQFYHFMASFATQCMQRKFGTTDRLDLKSTFQNEDNPTSLLNQLNALEIACYTMSNHVTQKPIPRSIEECAPYSYAKTSLRFAKMLLSRKATCDSLMQSKHIFATSITSVPFLSLCMEGYIIFSDTTFTESIIPYMNVKSQQKCILELDELQRARAAEKEKEILEEEDRERQVMELKKSKKRAKKKAQKEKRQFKKHSEKLTSSLSKDDVHDNGIGECSADDDLSSIDIIIDNECLNSKFFSPALSSSDKITMFKYRLSANAPVFYPTTCK